MFFAATDYLQPGIWISDGDFPSPAESVPTTRECPVPLNVNAKPFQSKTNDVLIYTGRESDVATVSDIESQMHTSPGVKQTWSHFSSVCLKKRSGESAYSNQDTGSWEQQAEQNSQSELAHMERCLKKTLGISADDTSDEECGYMENGVWVAPNVISKSQQDSPHASASHTHELENSKPAEKPGTNDQTRRRTVTVYVNSKGRHMDRSRQEKDKAKPSKGHNKPACREDRISSHPRAHESAYSALPIDGTNGGHGAADDTSHDQQGVGWLLNLLRGNEDHAHTTAAPDPAKPEPKVERTPTGDASSQRVPCQWKTLDTSVVTHQINQGSSSQRAPCQWKTLDPSAVTRQIGQGSTVDGENDSDTDIKTKAEAHNVIHSQGAKRNPPAPQKGKLLVTDPVEATQHKPTKPNTECISKSQDVVDDEWKFPKRKARRSRVVDKEERPQTSSSSEHERSKSYPQQRPAEPTQKDGARYARDAIPSKRETTQRRSSRDRPRQRDSASSQKPVYPERPKYSEREHTRRDSGHEHITTRLGRKERREDRESLGPRQRQKRYSKRLEEGQEEDTCSDSTSSRIGSHGPAVARGLPQKKQPLAPPQDPGHGTGYSPKVNEGCKPPSPSVPINNAAPLDDESGVLQTEPPSIESTAACTNMTTDGGSDEREIWACGGDSETWPLEDWFPWHGPFFTQ
jgi:hypothetical protein